MLGCYPVHELAQYVLFQKEKALKYFAKHKIKPYHNRTVWADNDIAQKLKELCDTPKVRMYSGRRMYRIINRPLIRNITQRSKHY